MTQKKAEEIASVIRKNTTVAKLEVSPISRVQMQGFAPTNDEIRFDPKTEKEVADLLRQVVNSSGNSVILQLKEASTPTPKFLSVFIKPSKE